MAGVRETTEETIAIVQVRLELGQQEWIRKEGTDLKATFNRQYLVTE